MNDPGDRARASVRVNVGIDEAFRIFTEEIELWWRRGPAYRSGRGTGGVIALEPPAPDGTPGRVFESWVADGREHVVQTGTIETWEPPHRFVMRWRGANFVDADPDTHVEVKFDPSARGTLVTVTHTGWAQVRPDHPVRHGEPAALFIGRLARWWGALLHSLRVHGDPVR